MDITEQEVWLKVYASAIAGCMSDRGCSAIMACENAKLAAMQSVMDFKKRFPAFQFASNENKPKE